MFIQNLTPKQQAVFLSLANDLVHADDVLEAREVELLNVIKSQASPGLEPVPYKMDGLASVFDTKVAKFSVIFELIGLGHADLHFDPAEQALVLDVAESLGLNNEDVNQVEYWVTRQMGLIAEANDMMEE